MSKPLLEPTGRFGELVNLNTEQDVQFIATAFLDQLDTSKHCMIFGTGAGFFI